MDIENGEDELPQHLLELVRTLPAQIDRKAGAQLVSEYVFPVSAQTVKSWPLRWTCPNGRALASPASYLTFAHRKARQAGATTPRWRLATLQNTAA
jgi:hypothetical protein